MSDYTDDKSPLERAHEARAARAAQRARMTPREYFLDLANIRLSRAADAIERLGNLGRVSVKQADGSMVVVHPTGNDLDKIFSVIQDRLTVAKRKLTPSGERKGRQPKQRVTYLIEQDL